MAKKLQLTGNNSPIWTEEEQFTISDFIVKQGEFLQYKKVCNLSERSLYDYGRHFLYLNNFINENYSDLTVRFDINVIRSYISDMLNRVTASTVNIRLRTLKVYVKFLQDEGHLKDRVVDKIKKVKEVKEEKQPLTPEDVKKLVKAMDLQSYAGYRNFTMMCIMLETGIRVNELCNLKISDVKIKEKYITVRPDVAKSRKMRILPISNKTVQYITRLIDIAKDNDTEYVFLSSTTRDKVTTNNIKGMFIDLGKKAGIDKSTSCHKFRHTCCTEMVKSGMSPWEVREIMGHSSLDITMGYFHTTVEELKKAHSKGNVLSQFIK